MIKIYCQNDQLCFVEKPAGTLSVPSRLGLKDTRIVVGKELETQLVRKIYPLHRLDFEVSGLMVFALTEMSHRLVSQEWESKNVKKTYRALSLSKNLDLKTGINGTWRSVLAKGKKRAFEAEWGKPAITEWEILDQFLLDSTEKIIWWQLSPITGRSHQLRFELSKNETPILGDFLYGAPKTSRNQILAENEIALRSHSIEFSTQFKAQNPTLFKDLPSVFVAEDTLSHTYLRLTRS